MKVYFNATLRGIKNLRVYYEKIYKTIEELGYKNVDDLLFRVDPEKFLKGKYRDQVNLYKVINHNIQKADIIVLETSAQSISMGYTINRAIEKGKPLILLYQEGYTPPLLAEGIHSEKLQIIAYTPESLVENLKYALALAKEQRDERFTLILPPKIINYLDEVRKTKKIPRSVFIRYLIEKNMKEEKMIE